MSSLSNNRPDRYKQFLGLLKQIARLESTVTAGSGLATEAKQDAIITALGTIGVDIADIETINNSINLNVDGVEALLTTIDADTSIINTEVVSIDDRLTGTQRTPSLTRVTGAGAASVAAGAVSVSIANVGSADATVLGTTLKSGETVTYTPEHINDTLGAISYDALTSELLISTLV